jgi:hypothetical protein
MTPRAEPVVRDAQDDDVAAICRPADRRAGRGWAGPHLVERGARGHFLANERAGAFYEREGFAVERIERSPTEDPALGVVWRLRRLAPLERTPARA